MLTKMDGPMDDLDDISIFDFDEEPQELDEIEPEPAEETPGNIDVMELMSELIDEVTLGLCFEVHRACKIGTIFLDETDQKSEEQYEICEKPGLDVFGHIPMKKQVDCVCPNCSRTLAASRFAPHLEKCMGMGRNSSRIASRRIANSGKNKESDNDSEDNDNGDCDWNYVADKKAKKFKKDKSSTNSPRRSKASKIKNGDIPSVGSNASDGSGPANTPYESMTSDERKSLLGQTCGVISEHTKKMCTRSHRCPQHTEEQRRAVRIYLLGQQGTHPDSEDVNIDIDSYEDGDSQALRDTLQWEAGSNPSPADSNSTTNSTSGSSSKKKKVPTATLR